MQTKNFTLHTTEYLTESIVRLNVDTSRFCIIPKFHTFTVSHSNCPNSVTLTFLIDQTNNLSCQCHMNLSNNYTQGSLNLIKLL